MVTEPNFERHLNGFGIRRDEPGYAPTVRGLDPHLPAGKRSAAQVLANAAHAAYCDFWCLDPRVQWALVVGWVSAVRADADMLQRVGGEQSPKLWQVQATSAYFASGILPDPEEWQTKILEGFQQEIQPPTGDEPAPPCCREAWDTACYRAGTGMGATADQVQRAISVGDAIMANQWPPEAATLAQEPIGDYLCGQGIISAAEAAVRKHLAETHSRFDATADECPLCRVPYVDLEEGVACNCGTWRFDGIRRIPAGA